MKAVCGFCYSVKPVWEYKLDPDVTIKVDLGNGTDWIDSGEWLACVDCARAIEGYDLETLVNRGMRLNPATRNLKTTEPKWHAAANKYTALVSVIMLRRLPGRKEFKEA